MGIPSFRRGRRRQDGQALVEFSLTAIAFLFLLVMIIEVGRIFGAYVLLQHATRAGARYAVTGQWYQKYADNPQAGWTSGSDDPLQQIPPCWPRFYDESTYNGVGEDANTADAFDYYEPYRNARTCSVEEVVLRTITSMVPLNPSAEPGEEGYYMLRVSGATDDKYPNTGTFTRSGSTEYNYAAYFPLTEFDGDNAGLSPGFAGVPQEKVVVQMNYRLPLITPLMRNIAPSIMLRGTAVMTNEPYGSTSLQREAILPPELVGLSELAPATEKDLDVTSVSLVGGAVDPLLPDGTADFDVEVANLGQIIIREYFDVKLYASLDPISGTPTGPDVTEVGSATVTGLNGESATTVSYHLDYASFPGAGTYYLYAWADAGEIVSEADEDNNVGMYSPVQVGEYDDLSLDKIASAPEVGDGDQVTYTLTVANSEYGIERSDVVVIDQLPPGATYVSDSSGGAYDPDTGVWTVGTLAPDTSSQLTITAVLNGAGGELITNSAALSLTEPDDDPGNDSASVGVTISYPETDLAIEKVASATEVDNGEQVTYTLTASNLGGIDATSVVVTDLLPTGAAYDSHSGGDYDPSSGVWTVGDLASGASVQLTIITTLTGENEEVITNTATIAADQPDNVPTNDSSSADVTVISAVDVSLEASAEYVGRSGYYWYTYDNYEFTVTARNNGTSDASGVTVTINRSSGDVQFDYDVSGDCSSNGGTFCDFGMIPAGEMRQLVYRVRISTYYAGNSYNVDFTLNTDDENSSTETYQQVTLSTALASTDLSLSKSVSVDEVGNGGEVTYTLTVSNPSDGFDATNVVVTDVLPSAAAYVWHSGPGNYSVSAGVWTVGNLDAGDSASLQITASLTGSVGAIIINTATVAADQIDLNLLNNVASVSVTIIEISSVDVSLRVDSSHYWRNYYRITVQATNHGSTDASGASVDISYSSSDVSYNNTISVPSGSSYHGESTFDFGTISAGSTETLVYLVRVQGWGSEYGYFTLNTDQLNVNPDIYETERIN